MDDKDFIIVKEDISALKRDVKYIRENLIRISDPKCKQIEKISMNRKMIYFMGTVLIGIISYLTGLKLF